VTYDVGKLLDRWGHDPRMVALIDGGMRRRRCGWCERELRPCNMRRHIAAQHFRQLTIYDVLEDREVAERERAA
jgi:hypothetical protein